MSRGDAGRDSEGTHVGLDLLVDDRAHKLKKPVRGAFCVFATTALRRDALSRECGLTDPQGRAFRPCPGGTGAAILVAMRRRAEAVAVVAGVLALILGGCTVAADRPAGMPMTGYPSGGPMMSGSVGATPGCTPPALAGQVVTVMLVDMGGMHVTGDATAAAAAPSWVRMMLRATPSRVAAGQVSLVAENRGVRPHEVVVLPLDGRAGPGLLVPGADGTVDETGALVEASSPCGTAGEGDGVTAGKTGWTTVPLPAGRYELVCNLPNHYADGMWAELDVG